MSKFYDDAQKWQLYVRHRRGRTLTQLQDETSITDKPLRAWFRAFDAQLSCPDNQDLLRLQEELRALREQHRQTTAELEAVHTIVQQALPEFTRFQTACRWIPVYGPNLTCRLFGILKSNFYYRTQRRPAKTQNHQRDEVLRPLVEKLYLRSGKRISAEAIRQKLLGPGNLHQQAEGSFLPAGMKGRQGNHFCLYVCGSGPVPLLPSQPAGPPVQSGGPEQCLGQRHHRAALCRWQALPVRCAGPILPQGPGSQGLLPE